MGDEHRAKAALIPALAGPPRPRPPGRVLELGAGGGQVAAATARLGYDVTAVELTPAAAAHARTLAGAVAPGRLTVVEGDFYTLALPGPFAVVTYWDGFGIGADADQRRLLRRIRDWLSPPPRSAPAPGSGREGTALIEVYTPWFWAAAAGSESTIGGMSRRYAFDAAGSRMLDTNWPTAEPAAALTQSLRCYSPADLRLLLEGTGLALVAVHAGGGFDRASGAWLAQASLAAAMSYVAVLVPTAAPAALGDQRRDARPDGAG